MDSLTKEFTIEYLKGLVGLCEEIEETDMLSLYSSYLNVLQNQFSNHEVNQAIIVSISQSIIESCPDDLIKNATNILENRTNQGGK